MYHATVAKRTDKPWGYELLWTETPQYAGKIIHIDAGKRLSLQYHDYKLESVLVLEGTLLLNLGRGDEARVLELEVGESADIAIGEIHRFEAPASGSVTIIEVSTPHLDDVIRLEDDYNREGTTAP
jgi:mannose-6-phosphate isomerase-like protein (cupin superfamily)